MVALRVENSEGVLIQEIVVEAGKVLLKQLEAAGIEIPNACRAGTCASCLCTIVQGEEYIVKNLRGEPAFPLGDDEVMTCIGGIQETDTRIILRTMT